MTGLLSETSYRSTNVLHDDSDPRRTAILTFIRDRIAARPIPSLAEIAEAFGCLAVSRANTWWR
jgi:hypothetical protein